MDSLAPSLSELSLKELLGRQIADFEFSIRIINCFKKTNINIFGDLLQRNEYDLVRIPNIGRKCLAEIKELVENYGLRLGLKLDGWNYKTDTELNIDIRKQMVVEITNLSNPEVNLNELFVRRIVDFNFSIRTINCLKSKNINAFGEMIQLNEFELLHIKNFGRKCLTEIKYVLEKYGLRLGLNLEDWNNKDNDELKNEIIQQMINEQTPKKKARSLLKEIDKTELSDEIKAKLSNNGVYYLTDLSGKNYYELLNVFGLSPRELLEIQLELSRHKLDIELLDKKDIAGSEKIVLSTQKDGDNRIDQFVTIEDELAILAGISKDPRNSAIIMKLLGWDGKGKKTLECVGREYSLTRERVRQIYNRYLTRLVKKQKYIICNFHVLLNCLKILNSRIPIIVQRIENELIKKNLLRDKFNLEGLLTAYDVMRIRTNIILHKLDNRLFICGKEDVKVLKKINSESSRRISKYGISNIYQIKQLIEESIKKELAQETIVDVISCKKGFSWLDEENGWFWFKDVPRNRLINIIKKILSICPIITVSELRAGISRYNRVNGIIPSYRVLLKICQLSSWCIVDGEKITRTEEIDLNKILKDTTERRLYEILKDNGFVLTRKQLEKECFKNGINESTFYQYLSFSPIITKHEVGIYGLRGFCPPPGLIEALKEREEPDRIQLEYRWKSENEIRTAHKITSLILHTGVINIPSSMKEYMQGEYRCYSSDKVNIGELKIRQCNCWGIKDYMRRNCEVNDMIIITFNISKKKAVINIGGEELLSEIDQIVV